MLNPSNDWEKKPLKFIKISLCLCTNKMIIWICSLTVAKIDRICKIKLRRERLLFRYSPLYPQGDICSTNDYYFNFMGLCNKSNFTLNRAVVINPDYLTVLLRYAKENLIALKIFFKEPYYTSIIKKDKISYINFVATVGGLMGLCMGLSFVSAAEWIYHFSKLFYNYCRSWEADLTWLILKSTWIEQKKRNNWLLQYNLCRNVEIIKWNRRNC